MSLIGYLQKAALCVAFFVGAMVMAQAEGGPALGLLDAAAKGDAAAIERALATGVNVDARDEAGCTALLVATHNNRIAAARVLIAAGADVNAKDNIADTPISMPAPKAASRSWK
jgi:ankyrin repeat protein